MTENNKLCVATARFSICYNADTDIGRADLAYVTRTDNDVSFTSEMVGQADFNFLGNRKVELGVDFLCNFFVECSSLHPSSDLLLCLEIRDHDSLKSVNDVTAKWQKSIDEHGSAV